MNVQNLAPVDYSNQRVLTTAQVAEVFGTAPNIIRENFRYAKKQFQEGVHYFKVTGEALRTLKFQLSETEESVSENRLSDVAPLIPKTANAIILYTEQGVARHCKMLNTDEAWKMFDELERVYFGVLNGEIIKADDIQPELPFNKQFSANARRAAARDFKAFKDKPQILTANPALARELIEYAKLLTPSDKRDGVIFYAINLLIGDKIF